MSRRRYNFSVYILASASGTLHIGVTNDLARRVSEHKAKIVAGFSARYHCDKLVYFEEHLYIYNAIAREKEIKALLRRRKWN